MNTLKSKINLTQEIKRLVKKASNDIIIFSPYINYSALKKLIDNLSNNIKITIITTWRPADLLLGYSDLRVYPYCKINNFPLLLNNKLHLKAIIIDNMKSAYIGSANITNAGLAFNDNYNYELGVINNNLTTEDKVYFDEIILNSEIVDDKYYDLITNIVKNLEKPNLKNEFHIDFSQKKYFLLSSLPMSENIITFYQIYSSSDKTSFTEDDIRSAEHDRHLYKIPEGLNKADFEGTLKSNFLGHPFITNYLNFIGQGKYFGETSAWLHDKVSTVPTPRRFDIKEVQKRINNFILHLSDKYDTKIPGRRSERFYKKRI